MPDEHQTDGQEPIEATPTTEELAAELAAVESPPNAGGIPSEPEPPPEPDPVAEPPPEAAPAITDSPEQSPEAPAKTIAPPIKAARDDKKTADAKRRQKAIADAPRPPDPSEEDLKIQAAKDEIRDQMVEVQAELEEATGAADACRVELARLSLLLNPHLGESDHHVTAVRGYVASQKELRRTRASSPERIKEILAAAGRAPIDQAFQRQRARGARRPTRPMATPAKPGGDAGPGATPPNAAE